MATRQPANIDIEAALAEAEEFYRAATQRASHSTMRHALRMPGGNTALGDPCRPVPADDYARRWARLWDLDGHGIHRFSQRIYRRDLRSFASGDPQGDSIEALDEGLKLWGTQCDRSTVRGGDLRAFSRRSSWCASPIRHGGQSDGGQRCARAITGRPKVLVFHGGYHGGVLLLPRSRQIRSMHRSSISSGNTTISRQ